MFGSPKTGEVLRYLEFEEISGSASIERLATEGLNGLGKAGSSGTL